MKNKKKEEHKKLHKYQAGGHLFVKLTVAAIC